MTIPKNLGTFNLETLKPDFISWPEAAQILPRLIVWLFLFLGRWKGCLGEGFVSCKLWHISISFQYNSKHEQAEVDLKSAKNSKNWCLLIPREIQHYAYGTHGLRGWEYEHTFDEKLCNFYTWWCTYYIYVVPIRSFESKLKLEFISLDDPN